MIGMKPIFFRPNREPVYLNNLYKGQAAFLICNGPSIGQIPEAVKADLSAPGIITMTMNNGGNFIRSRLWIADDDPSRFDRSIWEDPAILKFTPLAHASKRYLDRTAGRFSDRAVGQCPGMFFVRLSTNFDPARWLEADRIVWGLPGRENGSRSTMMAALHVLWFLGFRTVYLLGADFKMTPSEKYFFDEDRTAASIRGNNTLYRRMIDYFTQLRPYLDQAGYRIYNCNPASGLRVFEFADLPEALARHKIRPAASCRGMYRPLDGVCRSISNPRRICVDLLGLSMGDCLAAEPAIRLLKNRYGADSIITVRSRWPRLFENHPQIDQSVGHKRDRYDRQLRPSGKSLDLRIRAAEGLGVQLGQRPAPKVYLTDADRQAIQRFGIDWTRPTICLSIRAAGPKRHLREWPFSRWQRLADRLKTDGWQTIQIGLEDPPLTGVDHNLIRQTTEIEAAAILEKSVLLIGVDSGLSHLAAAVSTAAVILYGPVDPAVRAYETTVAVQASQGCRDCRQVHVKPDRCPRGGLECMNNIRMEDVWNGIERAKKRTLEALGHGSASGRVGREDLRGRDAQPTVVGVPDGAGNAGP